MTDNIRLLLARIEAATMLVIVCEEKLVRIEAERSAASLAAADAREDRSDANRALFEALKATRPQEDE